MVKISIRRDSGGVMVDRWVELVALSDSLKGCDVEVSESGHFWRGPLKELRFEGENLTIVTEWSAEEVGENQWKMITSGPFGINQFGGHISCTSWFKEGDTIVVAVSMMGRARILPRSAGNLKLTLPKVDMSI